MKQYLLTILFFISLAMSTMGQKQFVVMTPNPDSAVFYLEDMEYKKQFDIRILNVGKEKQDLYWKVLNVSSPSNWSSYVCDWNTCYSPGQDECPSDAPNGVGVGDSISISLHLIDDGVAGVGVYDFLLWSQQDPAVLDTVRLVFIAQEPTASKTPSDALAVRLFPNPTQDYFYLQGNNNTIHQIEVYSLLGKHVRSFNAKTESPYFVGDLSKGIYMVYLYDAYGKVVKIFRLRKK